jgi:hypothetical protein
VRAQSIEGTREGGRLGHAITNLGDIDKDGFNGKGVTSISRRDCCMFLDRCGDFGPVFQLWLIQSRSYLSWFQRRSDLDSITGDYSVNVSILVEVTVFVAKHVAMFHLALLLSMLHMRAMSFPRRCNHPH